MENITELIATRMVSLIAVLVICAIVIGLVSYMFSRSYKRHMNAGRTKLATVVKAAGSATRIALGIIGILWILSIFGFNVKSFVAGLGLASAIVGLALQDTLKDYMMGLHIIMDNSMEIGSLVTINEHTGYVESFTLRTTKIFDVHLDGYVYICNRDITSIEDAFGYEDVFIPIAHEHTVSEVTEAFNKVIPELNQIAYMDYAEFKGISNFMDNGTEYYVRLHCDMHKILVVRATAKVLIKKRFDEMGIKLAHNKVEVTTEE